MQALVVIDVQVGIFELPVPLHEPQAFLDRVRSLIDRARASDVPVIYIQHIGRDGTPFARGKPGRELHPAIAPRANERVIEKTEPDMFMGTVLEAELRAGGVDELIVCGFASEACVDTSVRSAFSLGLGVVLAAGAHTTTRNPLLEAHQIVAHHELVLARFARVVAAGDVRFG